MLIQKRPWGGYVDLFRNEHLVAKIMMLEPNQAISDQYHLKRDVYWMILLGSGTVETVSFHGGCGPGDMFRIPRGERHRIRALKRDRLVLAEVQRGWCDEADTIRLNDDYGRET